MKASIFCACNFAGRLETGQPLIMGIFHTAGSNEGFPRRSVTYHLAVELEAEPHEAGTHVVQLRFLDQDGKELQVLNFEAEILRNEANIPSHLWMSPEVGTSVEIPAAGLYRWDLVVDGEPIASARVTFQ